MFGTVRPCFGMMNKQEKSEYHKYYCGLCMGMDRCSGVFSRLFVNYDVCIAYLVADSMEVNTNCVNAVCPFFLKTIRYNDNPVLLDRMAQVNYLLVYHKVMDDIMDDNSVKAKVTARLMRNKYLQIAQHNRMAAKCIVTWMKAIREMEERQAYVSLDQAALPFGRLLEGVMATCVNDPLDAQVFGTFCKWLGMWIYIVDACLDIKRDSRGGKYNPIFAGTGEPALRVVAERKYEITDFLVKCRQSMFQMLELMNCAKNKTLIYAIFESILPKQVSDLLDKVV